MSLDFDLYVVTDRQLTAGRPLRLVVEAALRGGARAFQLREKDLLAPRALPTCLGDAAAHPELWSTLADQ